MHNKTRRVWLLRGALVALVAQGRASGDTVRIVVGHIVYCIQVFRPLLSVLSATYRFMFAFPDKVTVFDEYVVAELTIIARLLPFVSYDCAPKILETVYVSDASLAGFALLCCDPSEATTESLLSACERLRFKEERPGPPAALGATHVPPAVPSQRASVAGASGAFDAWASAVASAEIESADASDSNPSAVPASLRRHLDHSDPRQPSALLRSELDDLVSAQRGPLVWHSALRSSDSSRDPWPAGAA